MRKIIDIAIKDMTQAFRSKIAIVFMFVIPILMTAMFSMMFGGMDGEDEGFSLPITKVILVNQDLGSFGAAISADSSPDSIGALLADVLQSEDFGMIMDISILTDPDHARAAVDSQEAGLAVIIPEDMTAEYLEPKGVASLEIYQDPTLTIGPAIVKGVIQQILDGFSNSKITLAVALESMEVAGVTLTDEQIQLVLTEYFQSIEPHQPANTALLLEIHQPTAEDGSSNEAVAIVSMIMAGMTIFYVFFTGANSGLSILREEEAGTLPRLFTTPTPVSVVLSGKFLAIGLTISVQLSVLLLVGYLVFQIQWGQLLPVVLVSLATIVSASAFGIFLLSWVKTERQAGAAIGGVVTILGMMGMMPTFIKGMPNPPPFVDTIAHLVPQGWAVEGLDITLRGGSTLDVLLNVIVLLAWGIAFMVMGLARFRNRYA
jgi:ABC-2 type transport system permease protein